MTILKKAFFAVLSLSIAVLILAACQNLKAAPGSGFETLKSEEEIPLRPGSKSPRLTLTFSFLDLPEGQDGALRNLLWELLYDGTSPGEYAQALRDYYADQYVQGAPEGAGADWFYAETVKVEYRSPAVFTVGQSQDYYLGGAHGMQEKRYYVISPAEPEQLTLDTLVKRRQDLRPLLEEALRRYGKLQSGEPLSAAGFFEDTVEPADNFFLTREGLGFHWDPYEIAPYAMGPIEIVIPHGELRPLLTPRGLALFP